MSRGEGSSTRSSSPDSSAARRVPSLAIGVKTISCTLPSNPPHQWGLRLNTALTAGWRFTSTKGPVPLAFRLAWLSSLFLKSSGRVTLCFSHQALFMIHSRSMCCRKMGLGLSSLNSTVSASILRGVPTGKAYWRTLLVSWRARSTLNTTSSALKGAPSWNFTLGRSLKRQVSGSGLLHSVARPGPMDRSLPRLTSFS